MQAHLNKLETWSNKWRLQFAPHKCNSIVFSDKKTTDQISLYLYDEPIPQVQHCKFLGITFDERLNFNEHFKELTNRCEERIKLVKVLSNPSWALNTKTLLSIYKLLVRSLIEYSSILFDVTKKSNTKKLQIVQNDALRIILKLKKEDGNQRLYDESKIESIEQRMNKLNTRYLCKAINYENEMIKNLISEYEEFYLWNNIKRDTVLCYYRDIICNQV